MNRLSFYLHHPDLCEMLRIKHVGKPLENLPCSMLWAIVPTLGIEFSYCPSHCSDPRNI